MLTETDIKFIPATGKSRAGALKAMGSLGLRLRCMYPNGCPGVYLQGLIVFGESGEVIYENSCDDKLASVVATLADELDLDLLAYSRDSILCEKRSHFIDLLPTYQVSLCTFRDSTPLPCALYPVPSRCCTNASLLILLF